MAIMLAISIEVALIVFELFHTYFAGKVPMIDNSIANISQIFSQI
jgi:hypothetical protein